MSSGRGPGLSSSNNLPNWSPTNSPHKFQATCHDLLTHAYTHTQVELHKEKTSCSAIAKRLSEIESGWQQQKSQLEFYLSKLNAEKEARERELQVQLRDLSQSHSTTSAQLHQIKCDHEQLRKSSEKTMGELKATLNASRDTQTSIQHRIHTLQQQLYESDYRAKLGVAAQLRAEQVEVALTALREKSEETVEKLAAEKSALTHQHKSLSSKVDSLSKAVYREAEWRLQHQQTAAVLAGEVNKLTAALAEEKAKNAIATKTSYRSPTVSSVLKRSNSVSRPATPRSAAGASRPLSPHHSSRPQSPLSRASLMRMTYDEHSLAQGDNRNPVAHQALIQSLSGRALTRSARSMNAERSSIADSQEFGSALRFTDTLSPKVPASPSSRPSTVDGLWK